MWDLGLGMWDAGYDDGLGCFLEHLKNEMSIKIPQKILDTLFKIVEQQAKNRK